MIGLAPVVRHWRCEANITGMALETGKPHNGYTYSLSACSVLPRVVEYKEADSSAQWSGPYAEGEWQYASHVLGIPRLYAPLVCQRPCKHLLHRLTCRVYWIQRSRPFELGALAPREPPARAETYRFRADLRGNLMLLDEGDDIGA